MPIRKINTNQIADNAITTPKFQNNSIQSSDLSYGYTTAPRVVLVDYPGDDLAAATTGNSTAFIIGSDFKPGLQIYIGNVLITSYVYHNGSNVQFTTPNLPAGNYNVFVVNNDGGVAIRINGYQSSLTPTWITGATLTGQQAVGGLNLQLTAANANSYSLQTGSSLPANLVLNSNGLITGNITQNSNATYNFTVLATDDELQDTPRTFTLPVTINPPPAWSNAQILSVAPLMTVNSQISTYYNQMVATEAGKTITYSLVSGTLPGGTTLSTNGLIVGQFTDNVSNTALYNFRLRATDSDGQSVENDFSLTVAESDGYFGNVVLQLNGDSLLPVTYNNAANSNTIVQVYNQPIASTLSPYSRFWSVPFRNNGDYITFSNNGSGLNDFGTGPFTVEGWIYQLVDNAYFYTVTVSGTNYFVINTSTTGLSFTATPSGGGSSITGGNIALRTWTHIAVVREGTGTSQTNLFVNGTLVATGTNNMNFSTPYTPTLGAYTHALTDPYTFRGYINNFRVSNIARYTSSFNPSVIPFTRDNNTLGKLSSLEDFRTKSTPRNLPTVPNFFGSTTITPFNPLTNYYANTQVGSSYFIRGKSSYVDYGQIDLGTDPYTIEFWHMPKDNQSSGLFSIKDSSNVGIDFGLDPGGVTITSNTSTNYVLSAANLYTPNTWNHFALVRNGSTIKLFYNGANVNQITTAGYSASLIGNLKIGYAPTIGYTTGHIADFRVTQDIVYTGNTSPPIDSLQLSGNSLIYSSNANINTIFSAANTKVLTLQTKYDLSNKTILDDGFYSLTPNTFGNVTVGTFSPFSDGWSQYYDGTSGYLSFAANTAFAMGTGDFTVETFVNFSNVLLSYNPICQSDAIGSSSNDKWWFGYLNDGNVYLNCHAAGGFSLRTPFSPVSGTWYHLAAQRRSGNVRIYINGTEYTPTITAGNPNNYNLGQNGFSIGAISTPYYLRGYLSNFRLIKGQAIYTGNFTPDTESLSISQTARPNVQPILNTTTTLLLNNYAFEDKSLNAFTVIRNNDVRITNYNPFTATSDWSPEKYGGSLYFPGDGYIMPSLEQDNEATTFYSGNFSIECWYYLLATPGTQYIISKWATSNKEIVFGVGCYAVAGKTGFTYTIDGTNDRGLYDPGTCFPYQWTHVAVAKTGSTMSLYVNGVRKDTRVETGTLFNSSNQLRVGAHADGGPSAYWPGYVSGLRTTIGYSPYDANSTIISVPTVPATRVTGTGLLLTGNPYSIYDYSRKNNMLNLGTVKIVKYFKKNGEGSLEFNGTINDYISMPDNEQLELEAGNFTIEAWVYPTLLFGGLKPLFGHGTNNTNFMSFHLTSAGALALTIQSAATNLVSITSINTIVVNTWAHVALVRNGSTFNIFIDGVQSGLSGTPQTFAGAIPNYTDSFRIGFGRYSGESGAYFTGYIDDYRITKGVARYTTNFTPPTRRLGIR